MVLYFPTENIQLALLNKVFAIGALAQEVLDLLSINLWDSQETQTHLSYILQSSWASTLVHQRKLAFKAITILK